MSACDIVPGSLYVVSGAGRTFQAIVLGRLPGGAWRVYSFRSKRVSTVKSPRRFVSALDPDDVVVGRP